MARLFGTDGVRGLANVDITAELALDLSVAAAHVLGDASLAKGRRPKAVVGRDPGPLASFSPRPCSRGSPRRVSTSTTPASSRPRLSPT